MDVMDVHESMSVEEVAELINVNIADVLIAMAELVQSGRIEPAHKDGEIIKKWRVTYA